MSEVRGQRSEQTPAAPARIRERPLRDFRKLTVWSKAHALVLDVYGCTRAFPGDEKYGLTSQMRRSAMSVPTNIAEGCGRASLLDFARFLDIAAGSPSELDYQVLLSRDLGLLSSDDADRLRDQVVETRRMLASYTKRVRSSISGANRSL